MEIRTFAWQIPFEKSIQMDDFPLQRIKSSEITNGRFFWAPQLRIHEGSKIFFRPYVGEKNPGRAPPEFMSLWSKVGYVLVNFLIPPWSISEYQTSQWLEIDSISRMPEMMISEIHLSQITKSSIPMFEIENYCLQTDWILRE